ncbi:MAG TPA: lysophospholipid acyltransferase family protein [Woeseiaceae bacterium]|nr:lysophospholipid acyltransferase family protein [Woeseiaceae bacterium]
MLLIRSLVFQAYFFVSAVVHATAVFLCWPFPYSVRFGLARRWGKTMLSCGRLVCGLEFVVEGRENIPEEPCVVMIKHSTVFEAYAQLTVFPPQTWVLKRELMWIPIFGWGLAALKPIAIDRGAGHAAVTQVIEQGRKKLAEGIWVNIFPEGTRVLPGVERKYGVSGAALAKEARALVIPVAHNAGDFWPRRSLIKRPGLIRFCIGPPIDSAALTPKEINQAVRNWIESKMAEISSTAGHGRVSGDMPG